MNNFALLLLAISNLAKFEGLLSFPNWTASHTKVDCSLLQLFSSDLHVSTINVIISSCRCSASDERSSHFLHAEIFLWA